MKIKLLLILSIIIFPFYLLAQTTPTEGSCPPCSTEVVDDITKDPIYQKYLEEVRRTESSGRYGIENTIGYLGAYQFGCPALSTLGYVTADSCKGKDSKEKSDNYTWTAKAKALNVDSKASFLSNKAAQEKIMEEYTRMNWNALKRNGMSSLLCTQVSNKGRSGAIDALGFLKGSHLGGVNGTLKAVRKGNSGSVQDIYGGSIAGYLLDGSSIKNDCIPTDGKPLCGAGNSGGMG